MSTDGKASGHVAVDLVYTPLEEIPKIREACRAGFRSGKLRPIAYRKEQLLQLAYLVKDNVARFQEALAADLGRPPLESNLLEINATIGDALSAYHNVETWAKTERASVAWSFVLMGPALRKEPRGTVLIISPFNYPVWLTLGPLTGAIAAGNAAVIKPSELTPAVSSLITELLPLYLDADLFRVVNGSIPETTKILELQWDSILYTGSGRVGKIVATAAAKHLTPVTLELGGKSPVVIDPKSDMLFAARRILWGKCTNSGQTCTAPDYVLIPHEAQDAFVDAFKAAHAEFFPEGEAKSNAVSRIVSAAQYARLAGLVEKTQGRVVLGGVEEHGAETLRLPVTLVRDVRTDDALMSQELFGPVLPIVPVKSVDEGIEYINANDHPLALYVFSQDAAFKARVFDNTQSGSAVANEVLIQAGIEGLPFGGVGPSGYGRHTGKYTFDTFTHVRSTLDSPKWLDFFVRRRNPPYTPEKEAFMNRMLAPKLPPRHVPQPEGTR